MDFFQRVYKFNEDAGTIMLRETLTEDEKTNEINMLQEELNELITAFTTNDRVEIADALADIVYVALGTCGKLGIDFNKVMDEVCTSNESKYQESNGQLLLLKNEQGKITKGPNFRQPDLSFVSVPMTTSPIAKVSIDTEQSEQVPTKVYSGTTTDASKTIIKLS